MTSFYSIVLFFFATVVLIYFSPKRWHDSLTFFLGLVTAFIDTQSTEVSFTILLLLAFGFFLGFAKPGTPLRTGILLVVWMPVFTFVHSALVTRGSSLFNDALISFFASLPALGGTFLGALVRKHSRGFPQFNDALI